MKVTFDILSELHLFLESKAFCSYYRFIEKYGTHIVVGVKMGGKDVIYIKQQQESPLQQTEVQTYLKRIADERFSDEFCENLLLASADFPRKLKVVSTVLAL